MRSVFTFIKAYQTFGEENSWWWWWWAKRYLNLHHLEIYCKGLLYFLDRSVGRSVGRLTPHLSILDQAFALWPHISQSMAPYLPTRLRNRNNLWHLKLTIVIFEKLSLSCPFSFMNASCWSSTFGTSRIQLHRQPDIVIVSWVYGRGLFVSSYFDYGCWYKPDESMDAGYLSRHTSTTAADTSPISTLYHTITIVSQRRDWH